MRKKKLRREGFRVKLVKPLFENPKRNKSHQNSFYRFIPLASCTFWEGAIEKTDQASPACAFHSLSVQIRRLVWPVQPLWGALQGPWGATCHCLKVFPNSCLALSLRIDWKLFAIEIFRSWQLKKSSQLIKLYTSFNPITKIFGVNSAHHMTFTYPVSIIILKLKI